MNTWVKLQSVALAASAIAILLLVRGAGRDLSGSCGGEAAVGSGGMGLASAWPPGSSEGLAATAPGRSAVDRAPAVLPALDAAPLPRTFTRDAKVRLDIQHLLKIYPPFLAANPGLTLDDFTHGRVAYSDIRVPIGTPLVAATDSACVVPAGDAGGDPPSAPQGLTLQTYDVDPGMTVQDLIYELRGDSCISGLYAQGAVPPGALEPRVRAVPAVLPLSDQVKALAKADILEKAMEEGTSPQLVVAAIQISGTSGPSAPRESSREMLVRNPLAADDPSQPATANITVTRTQYSVPAPQGQQPRPDLLSGAIMTAVDHGARLIGIPRVSTGQIQSALDYAAAHGAQVVTLPSS